MKVPLSWLVDHVELSEPADDVASALDQLGLEVEAIVSAGAGIVGVVVARVLAVEPHPDADRLRLCEVDHGSGTSVVVCGASNVHTDMLAALARPGARLPAFGDTELTARKIRGVVSDGMLCSAAELGLGDDHEGIVELSGDAEIGADVRDALGLSDTVFDLSITPNRPDAMSVVGVARELAAHFGRPLVLPDTRVPAAALGPVHGVAGTVHIEAPDRCPRLTARVASVSMGESPAWMQRRLRLAGMRPLSNVVDVTNYVMLEMGRPLHAFDADRLAGGGLVVRLAVADESIVTLDGVEHALTPADLLICDAARSPQAIAGVMGAADAEVSDATTRILLESAYFSPSGIARTAKRLGLRSEASARFERGVDPASTVPGADRAMRLFAEVAAATVAPDTVDVYPQVIERERITVRPAQVNAILGTELDGQTMQGMLPPLGIEVQAGAGAGAESFVAVAPTWRPDLEREIDITEEIGRRFGLENIERTVPRCPRLVGQLSPAQQERRTVVDTLVGAGFVEIYSLSLLAHDDLIDLGYETEGVVDVENPLRAEESALRPVVLPGLLAGVAHNAGQGNPDVSLFETGTVFRGPDSDRTSESDGRDAVLPAERNHLAAVRTGVVRRRPHEPDRPVDAYDAVGVVEALRDALRLADVGLEPASGGPFHPSRAAAVLVDGERIGMVGEISPTVLARLGIDGSAAAAEIDVDSLLAGSRRSQRLEDVSRHPASSIDLAFVVDDGVAAGDVIATVQDAGGPLLEDVRLFDVFRSDSLGETSVSLAFGLRFRAPDRTLTDEQVGGLRKKVIRAVEKRHGAQLRG